MLRRKQDKSRKTSLFTLALFSLRFDYIFMKTAAAQAICLGLSDSSEWWWFYLDKWYCYSSPSRNHTYVHTTSLISIIDQALRWFYEPASGRIVLRMSRRLYSVGVVLEIAKAIFKSFHTVDCPLMTQPPTLWYCFHENSDALFLRSKMNTPLGTKAFQFTLHSLLKAYSICQSYTCPSPRTVCQRSIHPLSMFCLHSVHCIVELKLDGLLGDQFAINNSSEDILAD